MSKADTLQANLDAADQRVHEAREALRVAIHDRAEVRAAIAEAKTPEEVRAYWARIRQAEALTADEQAEREAAAAAHQSAKAAEEPVLAQLASLARGIDPQDGSGPRHYDPSDDREVAEANARQQKIRDAQHNLEIALGRLRADTRNAQVALRAVIQRTDQARHDRRRAVKTEWQAAQEAKRTPTAARHVPAFEWVRGLLT